MATPSSNSTMITAPLAFPVTEKLTRSNFNMWQAQVMPAIRGAQLEELLHGTDVAPPKEVVSYLLTSLSKEILTQVTDRKTVEDLWNGIVEITSSQTRARTVNTRIALATTRKGASTMVEYLNKMKMLADDMTSAGKRIDDEELVSYILAGLDYDYNPVVSAVVARAEPITMSELYTQLTTFEYRNDMLQTNQAMANVATRGGGRGGGRGNFRGGRGGPPNAGGRAPGRGNGAGGRQNRGGYNNNDNRPTKPKCQVCGVGGHTALDCWYRFDPEQARAKRNKAFCSPVA
ncbi:Unknown protein [Striga hermonthica]|uniref:CCHC-type domain-containing protein n=1 Tax=Striga hermonthica TaxID=68872 RepID=A0A9N7R2Y3_STRHE|nr:Unknown protein [Striga hermonthica]